jgi:hypothetical protein
MCGHDGRGARAAFFSVVGFVLATPAWGQSAGTGVIPNTGYGSRVDPYAGGLAPAVPGYVPPTRATAGTANQNVVVVDPLGMGYPAGAAVPMTSAQAGLYMLSMQQRMLGIGNGQLSGVRPGPQADQHSSRNRGSSSPAGASAGAAHTRDMNVPGGLAARYFNRGPKPAGRSQAYFQRPTGRFPQPSK